MAGNRRINQNQIALNVSPNVISTSSIAGGTLIKAYSPTVTVTDLEDGVLITLTDVNGTHEARVYDGDQGDQGERGEPGVSPTVSLTETEEGVVLTVTDETGEHTALIPKGEQGDQGQHGMSPIVRDGYWYLWDASTEQYVNSTVPVHPSLPYDNAPTANSSNLLTSGVIKAALDNKLDVQDAPVNVSELVNDAGVSHPASGHFWQGKYRGYPYKGIRSGK